MSIISFDHEKGYIDHALLPMAKHYVSAFLPNVVCRCMYVPVFVCSLESTIFVKLKCEHSFIVQVKVLSQLKHPNIVMYQESFEGKTAIFFHLLHYNFTVEYTRGPRNV